jgi:signal peptidase II
VSLLRRKHAIFAALTPLVIVLDQWTKLAVVREFRLGETVPVVSGFFNLTYIRNTGAAFGILANADASFRVPFFILVPFVALLAISYIFRRLPAGDVKLSTALSLVIGGAIGNLIDRVRLGYVIDFLDFHWKYQYHFPAFNVADSAICVGVAILMLDLLMQEEDREQGLPEAAPSSRPGSQPSAESSVEPSVEKEDKDHVSTAR